MGGLRGVRIQQYWISSIEERCFGSLQHMGGFRVDVLSISSPFSPPPSLLPAPAPSPVLSPLPLPPSLSPPPCIITL